MYWSFGSTLIVAFFLSLPLSLERGNRVETIQKTPAIQNAAFYGTDAVWLILGNGDLLYSRNGGEDWEKTPKSGVKGFEQLSFINLYQGWAITSQGDLWRTSDGGREWKLVTKLDNSPLILPKEHIYFLDELHGWVVDPLSIWRTSDGGQNWKRYLLGSGSTEVKELIHKCTFINPNNGWLTGENGAIYKTTDGGQSWQGNRITSKGIDISDIVMLDESTGWACGGPSGGIYYTKDGGLHWNIQQAPGTKLDINSICFVNKQEGWAVGSGRVSELSNEERYEGVVFHTTDGGLKWQLVTMREKEYWFNRVYFGDNQKGWLLARTDTEDRLYRSFDGGKTWGRVLVVSNSNDFKVTKGIGN